MKVVRKTTKLLPLDASHVFKCSSYELNDVM